MPLICPLCTRPNPAEADYCYHDGVALGGAAHAAGPIAVGAQLFPSPFVFPSGRMCRNFDELLLACEAQWEEAGDLLREGMLGSFFSGLGRADLSSAARRCAAEADPDAGLDKLLSQLPGEVRLPPRLAVEPLEINLGRMRRGAEYSFDLHLLNEGMGLLRGSVACADTAWLVLGEDAGAPQKIFQCRHDQTLKVRVVGKRLRAGGGPREGRLFLETNGGSAVVLVHVEPPAVVPFAEGVLAGAKSPRVLAEKTRDAPREAAVYFENGAVAAWYTANGWTYPVQGPSASGIAAVQQFFEALGLAAAPRVEMDCQSIHLQGRPGAALEADVVVRTAEKRPVFAHAASAAPWLKVGRVVLGGRTARIPLHVPNVPDQPGQRLLGRVQVTANGNQRFTVEVALEVTASHRAPVQSRAVPKKAASASRNGRYPDVYLSDDDDDAPAPRRPGMLAWVFAGVFLLLAVLAVATVAAVVCLTPGGGPAPTTPVAEAPKPPVKPEPPVPKNNTDPPTKPPSPAPPPPPPPLDAADLVRLLQSDDAQERISAVRKLAALETKAAPALHALLAAMKDGDADFRREALLALPKIGAPTRMDLDVLADLADDGKFPEGRMYALDALLALGADARPATMALRDALKDPNPAARSKAAEALGNIGPPARELARRDLIDALRDADPAAAAAAAAALDKMGPATITDAPDLQAMLQDKAEAARRFALNGFRELGPDAAGFAPYLEDSIAEDASPELRRLAVTALLRVAPTAARTADAFTKALSDADPEVRREAAAALAHVGVANGALPGLIQALGGEDETVGKAAVEALKGARMNESEIGRLGDALRTKNTLLRLRVMELLKPLGADAEPAVPGLCAVLRDGPGEPRQQAFALLSAMGAAGRKAGGALDDLLADEKFTVRLDAATTLAAVEGAEAEEAVPVLIEALRGQKPDDAGEAADRDRATAALARIGAPAAKLLTKALETDFIDVGAASVKGKLNAEARMGAVKALEAMGPAANSFKTLAVLSTVQRTDSSPLVQEEAKKARAAIRNQ